MFLPFPHYNILQLILSRVFCTLKGMEPCSIRGSLCNLGYKHCISSACCSEYSRCVILLNLVDIRLLQVELLRAHAV